jgi:hypothetical protein
MLLGMSKEDAHKMLAGQRFGTKLNHQLTGTDLGNALAKLSPVHLRDLNDKGYLKNIEPGALAILKANNKLQGLSGFTATT